MYKIIRLVFLAAIRIYNKDVKGYIQRVFFCIVVAANWRQASLLLSNTAPLSLSSTLQLRPESLGILVWPYISNDWSLEQRVATVVQHHEIISIEPSIDIEVGQSITVLNLSEIFPGLLVVIDRPKWFMREGELSINLFVGDERVYSLAFALSLDEGHRVAYVGGMQGRNIPAISDLYHDLTKVTYGCRPRDFLFQIFIAFCKRFSIERIYAVSEAHRHHRHPYFGKVHKSANSSNYDDIWSERGGLLSESGFYSLEVNAIRRSIEDVPAKKRSLYKKRYDLFDKVDALLMDYFAKI